MCQCDKFTRWQSQQWQAFNSDIESRSHQIDSPMSPSYRLDSDLNRFMIWMISTRPQHVVRSNTLLILASSAQWIWISNEPMNRPNDQVKSIRFTSDSSGFQLIISASPRPRARPRAWRTQSSCSIWKPSKEQEEHFKTEFEYQQLITRAPTFEHLNWNINSSTPIVGSLGRPWLGLLLWRMSL